MKTIQFLALICVLIAGVHAANAEPIYVYATSEYWSGSRTYSHDGDASNDTLTLFRNEEVGNKTPPVYAFEDGDTITISWVVTDLGSGMWRYYYKIEETANNSLSHLALEVSSNFVGAGGDGTVPNIGNSGSNVYFKPGGGAGDTNGDGTTEYTFDAANAPVWGDAWLKDGKWDVITRGFGTDPVAPGDSPYTNWIVTPDTLNYIPPGSGDPPPIPTPAAAFLALPLLGLIGIRRPHRA